jgi:hypothetical protein
MPVLQHVGSVLLEPKQSYTVLEQQAQWGGGGLPGAVPALAPHRSALDVQLLNCCPLLHPVLAVSSKRGGGSHSAAAVSSSAGTLASHSTMDASCCWHQAPHSSSRPDQAPQQQQQQLHHQQQQLGLLRVNEHHNSSSSSSRRSSSRRGSSSWHRIQALWMMEGMQLLWAHSGCPAETAAT